MWNLLFYPRLNTEPSLTSVPLTTRIAAGIIQVIPRLLGALFIFTAIQKIRQPASLQAVFEFDGFAPSLISVSVWSIILIELVLGGMLLEFIHFRRLVLLATAVLLMIYIAQLGYLLLDSEAPSCGCFGAETSFREARMTNLLSLLRNLCLLWPVFWVWLQLSSARQKS